MGNYLKLDLDKSKRHFIFGDIHGRYHGVMKLLDVINYDPTTDILYSVGDIIDRGYYSIDCLWYFTGRKNIFAVAGNHEWMAFHPLYANAWLVNGGQETRNSMSAHNMSMSDLHKIIQEMPFVIDVGDSNDPDSFRILHAEIPSEYEFDTETQLLDVLLKRGDSYRTEIAETLLWGRGIIQLYNTYSHVNPSGLLNLAKKVKYKNSRRTFSGHTPVREPLTIGNQTFLDLGYHRLCCMNALTKESFIVDSSTKDLN